MVTNTELHNHGEGKRGDIVAAVEAGEALAAPQMLAAGEVYSVVIPAEGTVHLLDLTSDEYLDQPKRKRGLVVVRDAESFNAYWDKHKIDGHSEVYADLTHKTVTAVLNAGSAAHPDSEYEGDAGFGDHRVQLRLNPTRAWTDWKSWDGKQQQQQPFAEFIEDHLDNIMSPSGADMLELAQSFYATTNAEFRSAQRLSDGQVQFQYVEETSAGAGRGGDMEVPSVFELRLSPFEGMEEKDITARLRYRVGGGTFSLGWKLVRPDEFEEEAFGDLLAAIKEHVGQPVLLGTPFGTTPQ